MRKRIVNQVTKEDYVRDDEKRRRKERRGRIYIYINAQYSIFDG